MPSRYKKGDNSFYAFADDMVPRHVTAALHLDYDTVAGADRFGNVFVLRLPQEVSAQVRVRAGGLGRGLGWLLGWLWGRGEHAGPPVP